MLIIRYSAPSIPLSLYQNPTSQSKQPIPNNTPKTLIPYSNTTPPPLNPQFTHLCDTQNTPSSFSSIPFILPIPNQKIIITILNNLYISSIINTKTRIFNPYHTTNALFSLMSVKRTTTSSLYPSPSSYSSSYPLADPTASLPAQPS